MTAHPLTPAQVAAFLAQDRQSQVKNVAGKVIFQETSRDPGKVTWFSSKGDNPVSPFSDVGGGTKFLVHHEIGDDTIQAATVDFNIIENATDIHEGYMIWKGALLDEAKLEIVPTLTTVNVNTGTDFNLYGGYMVTPASPGTGTLDINGKTTNASLTDADVSLVEMPMSKENGTRSPAYWNADWNTTTKVFENIAPAYGGDGIYNMFSVEVPLNRFVNNIVLIDSGFMMLQTADANSIGHGLRVKLSGITNGDDHEWWLSCILTFHREKTV